MGLYSVCPSNARSKTPNLLVLKILGRASPVLRTKKIFFSVLFLFLWPTVLSAVKSTEVYKSLSPESCGGGINLDNSSGSRGALSTTGESNSVELTGTAPKLPALGLLGQMALKRA